MINFKLFRRYFSRSLATVCLGFLLIGCSAKISDYQSTTPEFDMKTFFDGKLEAYGMVQNRDGKVIRRFRADLIGSCAPSGQARVSRPNWTQCTKSHAAWQSLSSRAEKLRIFSKMFSPIFDHFLVFGDFFAVFSPLAIF